MDLFQALGAYLVLSMIISGLWTFLISIGRKSLSKDYEVILVTFGVLIVFWPMSIYVLVEGRIKEGRWDPWWE